MIGLDTKDQWFKDRLGRFTASEVWKLFVPGKDGSMFGVGAMTYIRQKAIEEMTVYWENPKLEFVKPLLHGKVHELPAFEHYKRVTRNYSMRYFGTEEPYFHPYKEYGGGSPDGLLGEGTRVDCVLELKNPYTSDAHFEYLQFKDQFDLKKAVKEYYYQCQKLMLTFNAPLCYWTSFDDRFKDPRKKMKILPIKPDKKVQDELEVRMAQANIEKKRILEMQFD